MTEPAGRQGEAPLPGGKGLSPEMSSSTAEGPVGESSGWALRFLGAMILLLTLTPVHWILRQPTTGRFGESAVLRNASNVEMAWWGILLAGGVGVVLAILVPSQPLRRLLARLARALTRPPVVPFALLVGLGAAALSLMAGLELFLGLPTLVDGMVTRLQSRMIAHGTFALQLPVPPAAWLIPNTILTPEGWVSQYPPFPALLLAAGELVGTPGLVFPLLVGGTVAVSTLLTARLFPQEGALTRLAGLLLAFSPFLLFLGGGYLSHVPAAAFTAFTLYSAYRALDGRWGWALMVGLGSGAVVTSRPLLGLVLCVAFPVVYWATEALRGKGPGWLFTRLCLALAGGTPFAAGLALYNRHFFGHATRLGYSAAFGPAHGLGFHIDPWGNLYSPMEALGFTAVDLTGLGAYLLETPIPATALVGLFFLLRPRLPRRGGIILAWALLPVLANFVYWHHGFHLGPRMLYEAAPAWVLLTAMAALALAGRSGREDRPNGGGTAGIEASGAESPPHRPLPGRADLVLWSLLVSLVGGGILVTNRAFTYRWSPDTLARITVPSVPEGAPALVFVHGSWSERISARLQASGMRLDSIETALRRNDVCTLHRYSVARSSGALGGAGVDPDPYGLDFHLVAETPPTLEAVYLTEGNRILRDPRLPVPPECQREARADARGIVSLAPLIWQGDLPGIEEGRPMFVRDLGPEDNRRVLEAFPDRQPFVLMTSVPEAGPELLSYREGMEVIWEGGPSGSSTHGDLQELAGVDPASTELVFFPEPVHGSAVGSGNVPERVPAPNLVVQDVR